MGSRLDPLWFVQETICAYEGVNGVILTFAVAQWFSSASSFLCFFADLRLLSKQSWTQCVLIHSGNSGQDMKIPLCCSRHHYGHVCVYGRRGSLKGHNFQGNCHGPGTLLQQNVWDDHSFGIRLVHSLISGVVFRECPGTAVLAWMIWWTLIGWSIFVTAFYLARCCCWTLSAIVTTTMQIFVRADRTYTLDVEVLSPSFL
jgi:hypothetical protein